MISNCRVPKHAFPSQGSSNLQIPHPKDTPVAPLPSWPRPAHPVPGPVFPADSVFSPGLSRRQAGPQAGVAQSIQETSTSYVPRSVLSILYTPQISSGTLIRHATSIGSAFVPSRLRGLARNVISRLPSQTTCRRHNDQQFDARGGFICPSHGLEVSAETVNVVTW